MASPSFTSPPISCISVPPVVINRQRACGLPLFASLQQAPPPPPRPLPIPLLASQLLHSPEHVHLPPFQHGKLLSGLCTWGVGGPAKLFCEVHDEFQLASAMRYCTQHGIHFLVIGKGSNCLFDDRGFDGCIILNQICFLEKTAPGLYRVGSGYPYNTFGMQCSKDGFTGLEFASGIPGTVGGAIFMNAGADGQETAGSLKTVEIVSTGGSKYLFSRDQLSFSYRTSPFQAAQPHAAIAAATFELRPSSVCKERQKDYLDRRKRTQPVSERTAGCVFKNPGGDVPSAAFLIDQAGLKGTRIGGAKVSELHANFLVNTGTSQSSDITNLISLVKEEVKLKFGVDLKEEILYIPPVRVCPES